MPQWFLRFYEFPEFTEFNEVLLYLEKTPMSPIYTRPQQKYRVKAAITLQ